MTVELPRPRYLLSVMRRGDVEIVDEREATVLRLHAGQPASSRPDEDGPEYWVQRTRVFPKPRFLLMQNAALRATVECTHLLRTHHRIALPDGVTWSFDMPLFRIRFVGHSDAAGSLRVRMVRENVWMVEIDAAHESPTLLAAVGCLLLARWRSG